MYPRNIPIITFYFFVILLGNYCNIFRSFAFGHFFCFSRPFFAMAKEPLRTRNPLSFRLQRVIRSGKDILHTFGCWVFVAILVIGVVFLWRYLKS